METRPWEHSTGPKTPEGKRKSSMNAWKHGKRSRNSKIAAAAKRIYAELHRTQVKAQAFAVLAKGGVLSAKRDVS